MLYITISGWRWADRHIASKRYGAMVSISDRTGDKRGVERAAHNLLIDFDDSWPGRKDEIHKLATAKDVSSLFEFGRSLPHGTAVLCHCGRGRSRSTAAAIVMLIGHGLSPEEACKAVFACCTKATPNGWVIHLAESMIGKPIRPFCYGSAKGPESFQ